MEFLIIGQTDDKNKCIKMYAVLCWKFIQGLGWIGEWGQWMREDIKESMVSFKVAGGVRKDFIEEVQIFRQVFFCVFVYTCVRVEGGQQEIGRIDTIESASKEGILGLSKGLEIRRSLGFLGNVQQFLEIVVQL